jgi:hypothetical protein
MATFHVYVIGPVEGFPVKIGVAAKPDQRKIELQVGCWEPLHVHSLFAASNRRSAYMLEKVCHKRLSENAMVGEWFRVFAEDADTVLDGLCKELRCGRRVKNYRAHKENIDFIEKLENMGCG